MDSATTAASGGGPKAAQTVTTNTEDDPLLALTDLFSGATLDGRQYVDVPMSRALAGLLPTPQLNDHCCLALFDQFTLQEQLQLRAVCRQWQAIIEQKCRRMRSLKIFRSVRDVRRYCYELMEFNLHEDDQLKLKPVGTDDDLIGTLDQLRQCAHLFADITNFVYFDYSSPNSPNLAPIPDMFPLLTSLSLSTASSPFPILNSLPALTRLHLNSLPSTTPIPENLQILFQLESFYLRHYSGQHTASLLVQFGPQLTHLMLSDMRLYPALLTTAFTTNPSLATSVTHLTFGYIDCDARDYRALHDLICSRMTSLVYLHFDFINEHSFPSLAKLRHFTELHIDTLTFLKSVPIHLQPVPFVKQLRLSFSHIPTVARNFQTIFPAVESIAIHQGNEDQLDHARQYMAQFRITCQVTYHLKKVHQFYMGRHRELSRP